MNALKDLKVCFVHDWLVSYRGGEKVLESLLKLFPEAPIYTLFYDPRFLPETFRNRKVLYPKTLSHFKKFRKLLLPFLPSAIEAFELKGYDLVISTSSCVAKGVIPPLRAKHVSYIHSPMRYIWDQRGEYFQKLEKIPGLNAVLYYMLSQLRTWDHVSSQRVDYFLSNSNFVKTRVEKYYRRESELIHPPVSVENFQNYSIVDEYEDYFIIAGAFVPYKRFDLAIEACKDLGKRLVVAGSGPLEAHLRGLAGPRTEFVISPSQELLATLMAKSQAFLFPGIEDFGILPVEALACGAPVLAYKEGGALDYIQEGLNGEFFESQSVDSLKKAILEFDRKNYDASAVVESSKRFSETEFLSKVEKFLLKILGE